MNSPSQPTAGIPSRDVHQDDCTGSSPAAPVLSGGRATANPATFPAALQANVRQTQRHMRSRIHRLGGDHPESLEAMRLFAAALGEQGRLEFARQVLTEANRRWEATGIMDRQRLRAASDLAAAYFATGDTPRAADVAAKALLPILSTLPPSDEDALMAQHNLIIIRYAQGDHVAAIQAMEGLIEILEDSLGQEHDLTLTAWESLGSLLTDASRSEQGLTALAWVVEERKRLDGAAHPKTLAVQSSHAESLRQHREFEVARAVHHDVLELRYQVLGPLHTLTNESRLNLIASCLSCGDKESARSVARKGLQLFDSRPGSGGRDEALLAATAGAIAA